MSLAIPETTNVPLTGSVEVGASDLAWALKAVLPHSGRDDPYPALNGVHFELAAGWLYLVATDRYSLGAARIQCACTDGSEVSTSVHRYEAKDMRRRLKRQAGDGGPAIATLSFRANGETTLNARSRYGPVGGEFPKWRPTLGGALAAETTVPPERFGFDPRLVGRFAAAREGRGLSFRTVLHPRVEVPNPSDGPMMVALSERFAGAVMACRLDTSTGKPYPVRDLAAWREAVPAPEAAARPETAVA